MGKVDRSLSDSRILYHRVEGSGEPVLLLNGVAMSVNSWQPIARPLVREYRVIRCDLRGQLMSPGPPPSDVGGHVDDVVALLDELDLDNVHVFGTSYGGVVAALLAALLEPTETLANLESEGDLTGRLAMLEDLKTMPLGSVWNYHCLQSDAPPDGAWMPEIRQYEKDVLSRRN